MSRAAEPERAGVGPREHSRKADRLSIERLTVKKLEHPEAEDHLGAVEGERSTDPQQGNANAPALNENGQPDDPIKICEDAIGANADGTEG